MGQTQSSSSIPSVAGTQTLTVTQSCSSPTGTSISSDAITYVLGTSNAIASPSLISNIAQTISSPLNVPGIGTIHCAGVNTYYDNNCVYNAVQSYNTAVINICQQQYAPSNCANTALSGLITSYCNCQRAVTIVSVPTPPAQTCVTSEPSGLDACNDACWKVDYRVSRVTTGCYDTSKISKCTQYCNTIKPLANDVCKADKTYPYNRAGYGICAYLTTNFGTSSDAHLLYNAVMHDIQGTNPITLCSKETCCVKGCNMTLNQQVSAYGGPAINEYVSFETCISNCPPHETVCPPPTGPGVGCSGLCNCGIPQVCCNA